MDRSLHPYVVFLPSEQKTKILSAIFGSRAAVEILQFSLSQGIANRIYQKDLMTKLSYSNKTIIENLKSLNKLSILKEDMEKVEKNGRIVWVKTYQLSDAGRWFALLLAEERDLSEKEKAEILLSLFRTYVKWVKDLSETLHLDKRVLKRVFMEEVK